MVLNILDLNESNEENDGVSVHEDLLNTLDDELVTEGDNNQHGSLKPDDKEASNESNTIEKLKLPNLYVRSSRCRETERIRSLRL